MKTTDQNGYALLNVLLIFTLITFLGISLLSITISSQKFVGYSQSYTKEIAEAEMTLEEASLDLEMLVTNINNETLNSSTLLTKLSDTEKFIKDKYTGVSISSNIIKPITSTNNVFVQTLDISVPIGTNSAKKIKRTFKITTIADIFNYGVVTNGDLTLNGAVDIKGNIFVQKRLYLSNRGKFITNGNTHYPATVYPSINGDMSVKGINNNNQPYPFKYYNDAAVITTAQPNWTPISNTSRISNYFVTSPRVRDVTVSTNQINILGSINEKEQAYNTRKNQISSTYTQQTIQNNLTQTSSAKYLNNLEILGSLNVSGDLIIEGNLTMGNSSSLTVSGNIFINGNSTLKGTITLLNPNSYVYINGKTDISNVNLQGQLFISNSADITSDFNTNGTVYIEDNTTVRDLSNVSGGTAIILSNGNMLVANNSEFSTEPKEIDAFLYSNQTLEMYGVGSNIKIKGGVYGSNVILNATKGDTRETMRVWRWVWRDWFPVFEWVYIHDPENYNLIGGLYFPKNQNDPALDSRLQVEFKEDLILNPPTGIPTVQSLQVESIDQKIE